MEKLLQRVLDRGQLHMGRFIKSPRTAEYLYFDRKSDYKYNWIMNVQCDAEPAFNAPLCKVFNIKLGRKIVGHRLVKGAGNLKSGASYLVFSVGAVPIGRIYEQTELAHIRLFSSPDCLMAHAINPEPNILAEPGD